MTISYIVIVCKIFLKTLTVKTTILSISSYFHFLETTLLELCTLATIWTNMKPLVWELIFSSFCFLGTLVSQEERIGNRLFEPFFLSYLRKNLVWYRIISVFSRYLLPLSPPSFQLFSWENWSHSYSWFQLILFSLWKL